MTLMIFLIHTYILCVYIVRVFVFVRPSLRHQIHMVFVTYEKTLPDLYSETKEINFNETEKNQ